MQLLICYFRTQIYNFLKSFLSSCGIFFILEWRYEKLKVFLLKIIFGNRLHPPLQIFQTAFVNQLGNDGMFR